MRALICLFFLLPLTLAAQDWPQFRGPSAQGVAHTTANPPTNWNRETNIAWRTPLPSPGNGSPIVAGNHVYLLSSNPSGTERSLLSFDRATGKENWSRTVEYPKVMPTHKTNPYAGATPAADAERVYAWHGSAGLFAYTHSGEEAWKLDLGEFRHIWGYGGSPVLHGGKLFLLCAPGENVFLVAVDPASGKELWRIEEPVNGDGEKNPEGHWTGTWSTPVVADAGGREVLLYATMTRVVGCDPETGDILFNCDGLKGMKGELAYSSPTLVGDICVQVGGFGGPGIGFKIDPGASGNITDTHRLWRTDKNPQSIGSGIAWEGYLYLPDAAGGSLRCLDPKTGEERWREKPLGPNHWGSISMAAGRGYVTNQSGTTLVFTPSPGDLELLSANELGEACNTTPALAGEEIFLRTDEALYCIRKE